MNTEARPQPMEGSVGLDTLNVQQFEELIDSGAFSDETRLELIGGKVVPRMALNPPHDFGVGKLALLLRDLVGNGHFVREQKSLRIDDRNQVLPDLSVVRGCLDDYRRRRVSAAEAALVVEVADSSYAKDHGRMLKLYASAGIPVYWIVRIPERRVEVDSRPSGAAYDESAILDESAEAAVVLDGVEVGRLAVREFLP